MIVNNPKLRDILYKYCIRQSNAYAVFVENLTKTIPLELRKYQDQAPSDTCDTWFACINSDTAAIWLLDNFTQSDSKKIKLKLATLNNSLVQDYQPGLKNIDLDGVTAESFIFAHECGHALDRFFSQGQYTLSHRRNICARFLDEKYQYTGNIPTALKDWKSWDRDSSAEISLPEGKEGNKLDKELAEFTANKFAEALLSPHPSEAAEIVMMAMKAEQFILSLSKEILY